MSTLILNQQQSTQGTLLSRYSIFQIWTNQIDFIVKNTEQSFSATIQLENF
jgi:hypothetical protein